MSTVSVVVNYEGHNPGDAPGYVQLTRSAGRVYLVVDGRPVGNVAAEEFAAAAVKLGEAGAAPRSFASNPNPSYLASLAAGAELAGGAA